MDYNGAKLSVIHIEADVEAACKQHGVRGHLEHSDIEKIVANYSEDERQARIYGKFQHLVGLRFKQFSRAIHVIRPFEVTMRDFTVYQALDPHPRTPDATLWLAVDRKGTKYVVDELWLKCQGGTDELAQRIKQKDAMYRVERRIIDPSAAIVDQHTNSSLMERLNKLGLNYVEATKARTMSDKRIEDALTYQKIATTQGDEFIKAPEVFIFDTCKQLIWEMEHYRWDEWTGKAADNHHQKEKTVDKDDHLIEDLGRLLFQEPKYTFPPSSVRQAVEEKNYDPFGRA